MINGSIARRWAKAIFMIAEEKETTERSINDVMRFAEIWGASDELQQAVATPVLGRDVRNKIFKDVISSLSLSSEVVKFLYLLKDNGRILELPSIAQELQNMADKKYNRLRADVYSASPVDDAVVDKLKRTIEKSTGKTVIITRHIDKKLIGGLLTRVDGLMYDGTIRTQLNRIKDNMRTGQ
jgi:F-type H+-transporting ATPase subunit delta